jgi:hypothetical protein
MDTTNQHALRSVLNYGAPACEFPNGVSKALDGQLKEQIADKILNHLYEGSTSEDFAGLVQKIEQTKEVTKMSNKKMKQRLVYLFTKAELCAFLASRVRNKFLEGTDQHKEHQIKANVMSKGLFYVDGENNSLYKRTLSNGRTARIEPPSDSRTERPGEKRRKN